MKKVVNIGLVGLGNIGSYFYKYFNNIRNEVFYKTGKRVVIKYVSAKNKRKKRNYLKNCIWVNNPNELAKKHDVDILVELIGGNSSYVKNLVLLALKNNKHVITANKSLIASYGHELSLTAQKRNVNLLFEASVAGGIPLIKFINEGLIGNKITKLCGILNGTSNFILSRMSKSEKNFKEVLIEAKNNGYAESNPLLDINGFDVFSKIKILSSLCFNNVIQNNKILLEGIEKIKRDDIVNADQLGYAIKLVGFTEIKKKSLFERVHPVLVKKNSYIANIDNALNAIIINANPIGQSILQGEGAGQGPTTSALISDLYSILNDDVKKGFGLSISLKKKIKPFNFLNHICSAYMRINVSDKPGVLSSLSKVLAKNKISIKRVIQIPNKKKNAANIVIISHHASEKNYQICINQLTKKKYVLERPTFIRIEII